MSKRKFKIGDRVRVVLHLAGENDNNIENETGIVRAYLPIPNPVTGVYPGILYVSDQTGGDVVALDGELEKIP